MNPLGKIKDFWLWLWYDQTKPPDVGKTLAKHLFRIFVKCPSCDEKFAGHQIVGLTARIYSSTDQKQINEIQRKVDELYENLRQKLWSKVINEDEFDALEDALGV